MSEQSILSLAEFDRSGGRTCITSPYGQRWGSLHAGTDQGSTDGIEHGTPIHARLDGKVVAQGDDGRGPSAGKWVWFLADNGRRFKLFHTASGSAVPVNQWVKQGTVIAYVGASGTSAAHLHEEEHVGSWSNPINNTPDIAKAYTERRFVGQLPHEGEADVEAVAPPAAPPKKKDEDNVVKLVKLSDGSIYSTDGVNASWDPPAEGGDGDSFEAIDRYLGLPTPPRSEAKPLTFLSSVNFLAKFAGSSNIPADAAVEYRKRGV
jgi:murein DD-endopeptidase MepM/ murein hydrolase activator NlpD